MSFLPSLRCTDNYIPFLPRGQRLQALLPLVRFGPMRVRSRLLHFVLPLPFPARFFITFAFLIGKGTRETALIARFGVTFAPGRRVLLLPSPFLKQKVYANEASAAHFSKKEMPRFRH